MVTKNNIRISGVYGKKIIESITMPLVRENENMWQYKLEKTNFFYYPKSKKIYITGPKSEELYTDILARINKYLESLVDLPIEQWAQIELQGCLQSLTSLGSNHHIFNMEVLATLAFKKSKRLGYGKTFSSSYYYMEAPFYEQLMLYLIYAESDEEVNQICSTIIKARSEVDKYNAWNKCYEDVDNNEKVLIKQNLDKMKI